MSQVALDARASGDLPRSSPPEEVTLSLMAITMGGHCMLTQPGFQTLCPVKAPMTVLVSQAERLMDGWGWRPISDGRRQDALDRRIYKDVFPEASSVMPLKGS